MLRTSLRHKASTVVATALLLMTTALRLPIAHAQAPHVPVARPLGCPACPPSYPDGTSAAWPHTATAANSAANYTILDNSHTDNQPNAILMVSQFWNYPPGSAGVFNNHNIGVRYNGNKWTIFNQDGSAIPVGATFDFAVQPASSSAFVATATAQTIQGDYTLLSNPSLNNNPNAMILVTPVYGVTGMYQNHPIGVWYDGSQWTIYNEDATAMQPGEMFNVVLSVPLNGPCFQQHATLSNTAYNYTTLSDGFSSNGLIFETHNWGSVGTYLNHPIGAFIYGSPWGSANAHAAIFNEDAATMFTGTTFNYCVIGQ